MAGAGPCPALTRPAQGATDNTLPALLCCCFLGGALWDVAPAPLLQGLSLPWLCGTHSQVAEVTLHQSDSFCAPGWPRRERVADRGWEGPCFLREQQLEPLYDIPRDRCCVCSQVSAAQPRWLDTVLAAQARLGRWWCWDAGPFRSSHLRQPLLCYVCPPPTRVLCTLEVCFPGQGLLLPAVSSCRAVSASFCPLHLLPPHWEPMAARGIAGTQLCWA